MHNLTHIFWYLVSAFIEMVHTQVSSDYLHCSEAVTNGWQNFLENFPHLIPDLATVCFQAFQKGDPEKELILLVYEAHYPHVLQVEASNPASMYPLNIDPDMKQGIGEVIRKIVASHAQMRRCIFTGQHYAMVALYFMGNYLCFYSSR